MNKLEDNKVFDSLFWLHQGSNHLQCKVRHFSDNVFLQHVQYYLLKDVINDWSSDTLRVLWDMCYSLSSNFLTSAENLVATKCFTADFTFHTIVASFLIRMAFNLTFLCSTSDLSFPVVANYPVSPGCTVVFRQCLSLSIWFQDINGSVIPHCLEQGAVGEEQWDFGARHWRSGIVVQAYGAVHVVNCR